MRPQYLNHRPNGVVEVKNRYSPIVITLTHNLRKLTTPKSYRIHPGFKG
mgnify:CR=1 FL=1